jgi:hypothetical protein
MNCCNKFYADDVNLLGDNIYILKEITQTLTNASKAFGLGVNTEKIKYICCCLVTRMHGKIMT